MGWTIEGRIRMPRERNILRDPTRRGSGPMTHLKGAVWTERLLLVLILASLAGTLNLVLAIHRRVIRLTASSPIARTGQPPSPALACASLPDRPGCAATGTRPQAN